ncbi:hypothetical protein FB561_6672 [Kribbella amoyensis]|uniref:Uncharacterized protein n=1 Tax=Kribbella amoyensis TaxID=996641 RepID=A0A561B8F2_9ACTN|nr:hypothetical protein [Kribbella amoyensis]TWD75234.1 hypothetical protein FB561_6672 [Kribbella amoyensis]
MTFEDVAAAIDALAEQPRIGTSKVVAVGHFELIDPGHEAWKTCRQQTLTMLGS